MMNKKPNKKNNLPTNIPSSFIEKNILLRDKMFEEIQGLTSEEASLRLQQNPHKKFPNNNKTIKDIIITNLFNRFNVLILAVAVIIICLKHFDQLFFLFVFSINVAIAIIQEIKAKIILDRISLLTSQNACVIRDGRRFDIPISEIVIGDVLFLELGSTIVVDAKVIKGTLEVDESLLTGESRNVFKKEQDLLYSGSYAITGYACAESVAVGADVYISKLSEEAKKYKKIKTPLTETFSFLISFIFILLLPTALFLFFSFSRPGSLWPKSEFLLGFCGFVLGMMPIGLFLLTSITLAVSFVKLSQKKAYVKDLFGVEMLAQIDVLCLDKTGTLTDGNMEVKDVLYYPYASTLHPDLINQIINYFPNNNPTQNALCVKFPTLIASSLPPYTVKEILFFSSATKYSAIELEQVGTFFLGAPEFILNHQFKEIQDEVEKQSGLGYRVLLLARSDTSLKELTNAKTNYQIISLIMIEDTVKKDALSTINYFRQNDVQIKIISGDAPKTISAISQKLGVMPVSQQAIDLSNLTTQEVIQASLKYDVFGRATPEQKKVIINTLRWKNHKVAMIGDGINDILAFKEADISIAMASGSKPAQNVANLVLIDSQFSSLPAVVAEGRRLVNNLKKITVIFLVKTIFTFVLGWITIGYNFILFPKPPIHFPLNPLLWNIIDICFIGVPAFFLALEANNKKVDKICLKDILIKAFPYAFLILLDYIFILYKYYPIYDNESVSILLTLFTASVFLFLLIKNCIPFNKKKIILVGCALSFFCVFAALTPNLLFWNKSFKSNFRFVIKVIIFNLSVLFNIVLLQRRNKR